MSDVHSINAPAPRKPAKPYPNFPLFPHATGRWAKKVRGKLHYFRKCDDPDGALAKYLAEKDDLHAAWKALAAHEEDRATAPGQTGAEALHCGRDLSNARRCRSADEGHAAGHQRGL